MGKTPTTRWRIDYEKAHQNNFHINRSEFNSVKMIVFLMRKGEEVARPRGRESERCS